MKAHKPNTKQPLRNTLEAFEALKKIIFCKKRRENNPGKVLKECENNTGDDT